MVAMLVVVADKYKILRSGSMCFDCERVFPSPISTARHTISTPMTVALTNYQVPGSGVRSWQL